MVAVAESGRQLKLTVQKLEQPEDEGKGETKDEGKDEDKDEGKDGGKEGEEGDEPEPPSPYATSFPKRSFLLL